MTNKWIALTLSAALVLPALASDPADFKIKKAEFDKLSRRHDDQGCRRRRDAVYDLAEFVDQKSCRKLLLKTFEKDKSLRVRTAVVETLGQCGEPKELAALIKAVGKQGAKKGAPRAPAIALAFGIGYTPSEMAGPTVQTVLKALPKAKGDVRLALLEGLGIMAAPEAGPALLNHEADDILERFERNVAMGACAADEAVAPLVKELAHPDPRVRLGGAIGLARCGDEAALPHLMKLLDDDDPIVVEVAAGQLGAAKHEAAIDKLIATLPDLPLRGRDALARALQAITGAKLGHDVELWKQWVGAKKAGKVPPTTGEAPKLPRFFGTPVASDRVIVMLDQSRSMDWMGRFERAREGVASYVEALPDDSEFSVYAVERHVTAYAEGPRGGNERRRAAEWVRKQLTSRSVDLMKALDQALAENPDADTLLIATDSQPGARIPNLVYDETPPETMETFRRRNRTRRMRVYIAFVVPGGRDVKNEPYEDEYDDAIANCQAFAEESGGSMELVDK